MQTLIKLIKQFNQYRKSTKDFEAFGLEVGKEQMYQWLNQPQGRAFFDILLRMLNSETKGIFVGHTAVRDYEQFMYAKGRMSAMQNMLDYMRRVIFEREGK